MRPSIIPDPRQQVGVLANPLLHCLFPELLYILYTLICQVVVKVQRPGLKSLFDIDLKNVRALAVWLQKVDPKTDGAARDWVAIYDECSRILYQACSVCSV